jgi:hypothetical protein
MPRRAACIATLRDKLADLQMRVGAKPVGPPRGRALSAPRASSAGAAVR